MQLCDLISEMRFNRFRNQFTCHFWKPAAQEIAEQRGEQGPLRVHHIQEAYQRLDREGRIPHRTPQRQLALR